MSVALIYVDINRASPLQKKMYFPIISYTCIQILFLDRKFARTSWSSVRTQEYVNYLLKPSLQETEIHVFFLLSRTITFIDTYIYIEINTDIYAVFSI